MADQDIVNEALRKWHSGHPISDLQARVIASRWHGGQSTAMYAFASTGAILTTLTNPRGCDVEVEIDREIDNTDPPEREELEALRDYLLGHGPRGSQRGWTNLHW